MYVAKAGQDDALQIALLAAAGRQQAQHIAKPAVQSLDERDAPQEIVPIFEKYLARISVDQAAHGEQQQESRDQAETRPIMRRAHDFQSDQRAPQPFLERVDDPPNDVHGQRHRQHRDQAAHRQCQYFAHGFIIA
jgi:hypothetical protein